MLTPQEIGANLKKARHKKGMTLNELAEITHISQAALSYYENGQRMPRYENMHKIAEALGRSVTTLFF